MKRILSLVLVLVLMSMIITVPTVASAETGVDTNTEIAVYNIHIGDYIKMGTYYDEPILWRCVGIDEKGPLIFSDKIICIKPFDAAGEANITTGSHGRDSGRKSWGSNYWGDSNMRSWLNSNASAGNVNWLCGNPPDASHVWNGWNDYDQEAGFLTNFTQEELKAIKEVTQKSILSYPEIDAGMVKIGNEKLRYVTDIADVVANYDSAYSEYISDKMFLLDIKQIYMVYNNRNILGDYYIGRLSSKAVKYSEYSVPDNYINGKWNYWLRTPDADYNRLMRCVQSDGCIDIANAYHDGNNNGNLGVRPAFYLNQATTSFKSGSGIETDPYIVDDTNSGGSLSPDKAPIIKSAKMTYGGETYDILKQAVTVEEDSGADATIEATADDNGCKNVHVYVTQGVGTEVDITGVCKDIKPGKDFSANKDIYILAIDEDTGKSTSKKTKLKISSLASGKLGGQSGVEGLNFKLGGDTGFTIPDSVPVFGGTEINWEFDFIPISVEYDREDNNKINVVFGTNITKTKDGEREYFSDFNFKEYKKSIKKAASKQNRTLKQLRNDFKMSDDIKMSMFGGNLLGGGSGEKGSSVDVAGYAEMHMTENGLQFTEGQLCVNVEFTYNYQGQIFIWVVPLYYEFGGGAGVGFEGGMKDVNPISFSPEFEAYLTGKIMGSIGGGVGIAKVATAGAAGEAALNLKKSLQNSYFKADVDGSANFNVKVFGKEVAKKIFASGNFLIYETGNSKGMLNKLKASAAEADDMFGFDVNAVYENEPRGYIKTPTLWLGSEPEAEAAAEYSNKNLKRLAENIYTECAPQICEAGGEKIMIMQWDDPSRSDADRTMLVYSVYDEASGTWSEPTSVDDDGTADFYPCFRDGYLVWQNEKTTLSDNMTLTDIAKLGEICVSKWNGNGFDKPARITDNNSLDTQPQIAVSDEGASVVWTTNTDNDIMGITGSNSIMRSDFDGAAWSAPREIRSGLNAITNITAGSVNGDFYAAYVTDDDNDLNTIDDRDIKIIGSAGEIQLTHNDVLDSNPIFANNMIYYYSGGNIAYSEIDGTGAQTVFADAKAGLTDSFTVSGNNNGDAAIWWTKAENGGAEVYSTLFKNGAWSDEILVTNVGNKAKYPSGVLNGDGTMLVAFNNGVLENNEIVKTDLYTVSVVPSYDLEITDAYIDEETMTVYATIKNSGELNIDSYAIAINDGGINSEKTITQPIKAGESADVSIEYNKPQNFSKRSVKLTVSIQSGEEYYTENNSKDFVIGNADIFVDNVSANTDETLITADISNIGYDKAGSVKISLCDGDSVIDERNLTLSAGDSSHVEFSIDKASMRFPEATKTIYVKAEFDGEEASLGNNDGYVLIGSPSGMADHEAEILGCAKTDSGYVINTNAANNTESAVSCNMYAAVYAADGTLKACGTVPAEIEANSDIGVDIPVSCEIEAGDTIKAFMWSDSLEPLASPAELDM